MRNFTLLHQCIAVFLLIGFMLPAFSNAFAREEQPVIAIIIDDLGDNLANGITAVYLPGEVTVSILPHKKYSVELAEISHQEHKEVMLHLPMQPIDASKAMGPGGLTFSMTRQQLINSFRESYNAVPYVVGVNNHMGSLLTSLAGHMNWLMKEIKQQGNLYFVDSRTHHASVANFIAGETQLPSVKRDIFLDHTVESAQIQRQLEKLVKRAFTQGYALAIGHPHHETLSLLNEWLPKIERLGIKLVSVSKYIALKQQGEKLWHASLSHSPKDVKN